jgi:aminopeptidase YwaD
MNLPGLKRSLGALVLVALVAAGVAYGISSSSSSKAHDTALAPTATTIAAPSPSLAVATLQPAPTVAPTLAPRVRLEPDGQRIYADVKQLADVIGPRPAGTQKELDTANMLADRLRSLGYDVYLQEFTIGTPTDRPSDMSLLTPESKKLATLPFDGSATASVQGRLVAAGTGKPSDFKADASGAIVLVKRSDQGFNTTLKNAEAAGAIGLVIYNNAPDLFRGGVSSNPNIPVLAITGTSGDELAVQLASAPITAQISVGPLNGAISRNVIATPPGHDCETVTGGHYDSVPQAPGASDNGTGTATVLEIASLMAQNGEMGDNCFVLFGAEELGLLGSKYYVGHLDQASRARLKAMLNFDMVGVGDQAWWLIGSPDLQERMGALAKQLGINDAVPSTLIRGLSSDHASFEAAGIPVLMFHRWEDPLLHTPQDVSARVQPDFLEQAARMGVALLESLNAGG